MIKEEINERLFRVTYEQYQQLGLGKKDQDSPFTPQNAILFKATINGKRMYVLNFCNPRMNFYAFESLKKDVCVYEVIMPCTQLIGRMNTEGYNFINKKLKEVNKDVYIQFELPYENFNITVDEGKISEIKNKTK